MTADIILVSDTLDDIVSNMPWDEADDYLWPSKRASQDGAEETSSIDGSLSNQWRRIGQARRRLILSEDQRKGGTYFNLNRTCNIDRYFQVAHRALEQFHRMYEAGGDLEEAYIMGHRMVSFLTECLPNHPGFRRPSSAELRKKSLRDLESLQHCLEDLAFQIDEEQCNKFAEDFDPIVHEEDSDTDDDDISVAERNDWASFGWTGQEKRQVVSPTSTVATSGTASMEIAEYSSSDDSMPDRRIDFSDYEEDTTDHASFVMELGTEFLEKVAREDVQYESDSEAADSWAQGDDADSFAPSCSSGQGIMCDPARIAFRQMKLGTSKPNSLSPIKCEDSDRSQSSQEEAVSRTRPDPPVGVSMLPCREGCEDFEQPIVCKTSSIRQSDLAKESTVASEIQRFLDASFEYDPISVFDSSMERLNRVASSHSQYRAGGRYSQATRADDRCSIEAKENTFFSVPDIENDSWVKFDPSLGQSRNFRAPDFHGRFS